MASISAAALVNRVLRFSRFSQIRTEGSGNASSPQAQAALLNVNSGIDAVLNNFDWDFAVKNDGVLMTTAALVMESDEVLDADYGEMGCTNGSELIAFNTTRSQDSLTGQGAVLRIVNKEDDSFGNTAFRLNAAEKVASEATVAELDSTWPGDTITPNTGKFRIFASEYALPDKVRRLRAVNYHERSLLIKTISDSIQLEELIYRPWDSLSDDPYWVAVGGTVEPTIEAQVIPADHTPDERLRIIIGPYVPLSSYRLDYSYVYRYPHMAVDATDTLSGQLTGITEQAIDFVTKWAYAESLTTKIGNEGEDGRRQMRMLERDIEMALSASSPNARGIMHPAPFGGGGFRNPRDSVLSTLVDDPN